MVSAEPAAAAGGGVVLLLLATMSKGDCNMMSFLPADAAASVIAAAKMPRQWCDKGKMMSALPAAAAAAAAMFSWLSQANAW
jgi:hypothetical protein